MKRADDGGKRHLSQAESRLFRARARESAPRWRRCAWIRRDGRRRWRRGRQDRESGERRWPRRRRKKNAMPPGPGVRAPSTAWPPAPCAGRKWIRYGRCRRHAGHRCLLRYQPALAGHQRRATRRPPGAAEGVAMRLVGALRAP
jgi:hypothetical protein